MNTDNRFSLAFTLSERTNYPYKNEEKAITTLAIILAFHWQLLIVTRWHFLLRYKK